MHYTGMKSQTFIPCGFADWILFCKFGACKKHCIMNRRTRLICVTAVSLLFLAYYGTVFSQVVKSPNVPRDGDRLSGFLADFDELDESGRNILWDMSHSAIDTKLHRKSWRYAHDGILDSLCCTESGTLRYFRSCGDRLLLNGIESNQEKVEYDKPVEWLRFPIAYGDSAGGVFHGVGQYCDRLKVRIFGQYSLAVDGEGRMVLPDGCDTLRNVLRVHLRQTETTLTYPKGTAIVGGDEFVADSMPGMQLYERPTIIRDEYRWYALGYRYPILEVTKVSSCHDSSLSYSTAFYFPPDGQDDIAYDYENQQVLNSDSGAPDGQSGGSQFRYRFSQNVSGKSVSINYESADGRVDVNAVLADIGGIVIATKRQTGMQDGEITFDCGNLRSGQYVVYIHAGTQRFSETFSIE